MRFFSGRVAVVAALALGALTSFLTWQFVDQASQNKQTVAMSPVVVAVGLIGPRTMITPDMVRVQRLPSEAVHPAAAHSPTEVVGKVARLGMVGDEQVLMSKLFLQREESGLAFSVPDGMRAVSVSVSEVISSGGMIVPGDRVDVIGVFETKMPVTAPTATPVAPITQADGRAVLTTQPANTNNSNNGTNPDSQQSTFIATVVLEDVPVLAIAQKLEGEDTRDNTQKLTATNSTEQVKSNPQPLPAAKTATFAVNPDDALKLVLAEDRGKIRLALRRAGTSTNAIQPQQQQQQRPAPVVPMSAVVASRGN